MNSESQQIALITGASSGIGKVCARHLHAQGLRVYGTSRRARELSASTPFELVQMDVTCDASVEEAIQTVVNRTGRLDVVINNAGYGLAGAVEDTSIEEARAQLETNFFGVLRVCRGVLPVMRRQHAGRIITISSLGGRIALPYQALYSASKFAVSGLMQALRTEVQPFGIQVVLVEPGNFRTNITSNRRLARAARNGSPYEPRFARAMEVINADEEEGPPPDEIGPLVERIIRARAPRTRYVAAPLFERFMAAVHPLLPDRVFERILMSYYDIQ